MRPHKAALGSITGSLGRSWGSAPCNACLGLLGNAPMRSPRYDRILASTALSLMLATPLGAFAQDSEELAATFNERFPADQTSTQPYLEIQKVKKERRVTTTTTRAVTVKRPRSHVVVAPRSFLNAGCCRVNANSSITLSRQPMLRWTWSAILAVASGGTIRPCRVRSFLRNTARRITRNGRPRRGRLGQMSRRKSEITGHMNERGFPHLCQTELSPGCFR